MGMAAIHSNHHSEDFDIDSSDTDEFNIEEILSSGSEPEYPIEGFVDENASVFQASVAESVNAVADEGSAALPMSDGPEVVAWNIWGNAQTVIDTLTSQKQQWQKKM